ISSITLLSREPRQANRHTRTTGRARFQVERRPVLIGNGEAPGNVGEADTRRSPLVRLAHADAVVLDLQANRIVLRACRDPQVAGAWLRPESVLQGVRDDRLQDE